MDANIRSTAVRKAVAADALRSRGAQTRLRK
jgi:hypothetical protein